MPQMGSFCVFSYSDISIGGDCEASSGKPLLRASRAISVIPAKAGNHLLLPVEAHIVASAFWLGLVVFL
jgi:hypothetical protein